MLGFKKLGYPLENESDNHTITAMKKLIAFLAVVAFGASIATACPCQKKDKDEKKEGEAAVLVIQGEHA